MTRRLALLALVTAGLALGPAAAAFAHGSSGSSKHSGGSSGGATPTHVATADEEAATFLQNLVGGRSGESESDATASVAKLVGYWKNVSVSSTTKQPIPGFLTWYAKRKSATVALAGINALAQLGKGPGAKNLSNVLDGLLGQKDPPAELVAAAFTGLKTAADSDPTVMATVLQALAMKDKAIVLKAIDVFGAFDSAPVATRRHFFDALLTSFTAMAVAAAKPEDKDAVDKWTSVSAPAVAMLGTLSHQQFADIPAARKWFVASGGDNTAWK